MTTETTTQPAVLYVRKRFTSGLLKGLSVVDAMPFSSVESAARFVRDHRARPVKPAGGSSAYVVEDASFQNFAR